MIALTSCRPIGKSAEYDANQIRAKQSWESAFDQIIYLNDYERVLDSNKTLFIPFEPFPRIHALAEILASQDDWGCIINADIVVGSNFRRVEHILRRKNASASCSRRYEFGPEVGIQGAALLDNDFGLDFFAAIPKVWKKVAELCPAELRHGCQRWDGWLLAFLNAVAAQGFYSITRQKTIFHPAHGDRKYGYDIPNVPVVGNIYFPPELV